MIDKLNNNPVNIHQLEYIIAVDKYNHFGKAAQACFITQPTLSAMIQKLEEELNVKIFDRTSHPIRTTDVGIEMINQAKVVIDAVMELKSKANALNNILSGKINLGIIPTVSTYLISEVLLKFLDDNKKIQLNIKEMSTENVIKALKSGELDAGIISTPHPLAEEFHSNLLYHEELMIYSTDQAMKGKVDQFLTPEDIDVNKIWLLEEGNCLRNQFKNICHLKENTSYPKNLEFVASNLSTLIQMVEKLGGITIIPEIAAKHDAVLQNNKESVFRFLKPYPCREISVIYYKPTYKQKIIDQLVHFIQESMQNQLNYNIAPEDYLPINAQ